MKGKIVTNEREAELRKFESQAMRMVRAYLLKEVYHDADHEELAKTWGVKIRKVRQLLLFEIPKFHEIVQLLDLAGFDLGIAIHDPGSGKEVTLYAANNLSGEAPIVPRIKEQTPKYKTPDTIATGSEEGLDFLPVTNERAVDGSFDIGTELGPDAIEGEFQEIDSRDLLTVMIEEGQPCGGCGHQPRMAGSTMCENCTRGTDVSESSPTEVQFCERCKSADHHGEAFFCGECGTTLVWKATNLVEMYLRTGHQAELDRTRESDLCHNCLNHAPIPDSDLCHYCTVMGVECDIPEEPEESEYPLSLNARVDLHKADQSRSSHTERLLRQSGLIESEE